MLYFLNPSDSDAIPKVVMKWARKSGKKQIAYLVVTATSEASADETSKFH